MSQKKSTHPYIPSSVETMFSNLTITFQIVLGLSALVFIGDAWFGLCGGVLIEGMETMRN